MKDIDVLSGAQTISFQLHRLKNKYPLFKDVKRNHLAARTGLKTYQVSWGLYLFEPPR